MKLPLHRNNVRRMQKTGRLESLTTHNLTIMVRFLEDYANDLISQLKQKTGGLTLALGSSMLSFTGMGTLSSNFCSSSFSSYHKEQTGLRKSQETKEGSHQQPGSESSPLLPSKKTVEAHLSHSDILEL